MADGPIAYVEFAPDGTELHVYRASALGMCDTALMYALHGVEGAPPPAAMMVKFAEGHVNEPVILAKLAACNPQMVLVPAGMQERVELRFANAIVRGHIDGRLTHGNYQYLVEAKALGDALWKDWVAAEDTETRWPKGALWEKYALQASVYAHATGLPLCFVCGHKDDQGEVQEIVYRWYATPPVSRMEIMLRVGHLEQLARAGMPVEDCVKGEYPCPYYQMHGEKGADDDVLVLEDTQLADLIAEVDRKRLYAKGPNDAVKLAEAALKKYLEGIDRAHGGDVTRVGKWRVTWYTESVPAGTIERRAYTKNYYKITKV